MNKITNFLCLSLLLLGITAQGMDYLERQLIDAATRGNLGEVERLINQDVSVQAKNDYGHTALLRASLKGHEAVCKLLIENKASTEAKDEDGRTPLHYAALAGREAVCKLLIENKALVEAQDIVGSTPLVIAVAYGHENVCELLIDVQLEQARKDKKAIVTFLEIARKRNADLLRGMPKELVQIIAQEAFNDVKLAKLPVIAQIYMMTEEKCKRWLDYLKQQMNSPIK